MQQTREPTSLDPKRVIAALNVLVEACKDGEKGYKNAAADVRDLTFRAIFTHYSQQRSQFAAALQATIERYGGYPENNGSVVGALRRGWQDLRSALEGGTDQSVLNGCERGEAAALREYDLAMRKALPHEAMLLVKAQRNAIEMADAEIRRLRALLQ